MLNAYYLSEIRLLQRKPRHLIYLLLSLLAGLLMSPVTKFSFSGLHQNSPWVITYITGLLSLSTMFLITLLTVQVFFREKETGFDEVLYTTPLLKKQFLLSRLMVVVSYSFLYYFLFHTGWMIGQFIQSQNTHGFGAFHWRYYYLPLVTLVLPNILFCAAITCFFALVTRQTILVYIGGLSCYILYIIIGLFTNSPLFANASPVSQESMYVSAWLDPFGLSAFFYQTAQWTLDQRNSQVLSLTGVFLFNRLIYFGFAFLLAAVSIAQYRFRARHSSKSAPQTPTSTPAPLQLVYQPVLTRTEKTAFHWQCCYDRFRMDFSALFRSKSFVLLMIIWLFFLCMEMMSEINAGVRLPSRYASTALLVKNISASFPFFSQLTLLFYSVLLYWKSADYRMNVIESATPFPTGSRLLSNWMSLSILLLLLLTASILAGLAFQWIFNYTIINWLLYVSLYYTAGWPAILTASIILCIHHLVKNKYIGVSLAAVFLLLTQSFVGNRLGLQHPLWQFAKSYLPVYSDMTGYGAYMIAFHWKMFYWSSITLLMAWLSVNRLKSFRLKRLLLPAICLLGILPTGYRIVQDSNPTSAHQQQNWQESYERTYRPYANITQPTIVSVKTLIDLYPSTYSYSIKGDYMLVNTTDQPLDSCLLYVDPSMQINSIQLDGSKCLSTDSLFGHHRYQFLQSLLPGDSLPLKFELSYTWSPFNRHAPFNAIVNNGSFFRISRYYPIFGYQQDLELEDSILRENCLLGAATPVASIETAKKTSQRSGIRFNATVSTEGDQTVVGTGDPVRNWKINGRHYFEFTSPHTIPFRFGFSSGRYAVRKDRLNNVELAVFYHPDHAENAARLLTESKRTLAYCEENFGPYLYKTISFAEVSSFSNGFNGTAYPANIFMTENMSFHADLRNDSLRDVINELAGHELAHQWWGTAQLVPAEVEGANVLTETLAMYTEMMIYKQKHGEEALKKMVDLHQSLYDMNKLNIRDEPLFKVSPGNYALAYHKGTTVMYRLHQLMGEQRINGALKELLLKHRFPKEAATTEDLIRELLAAAPEETKQNINSLFR